MRAVSATSASEMDQVRAACSWRTLLSRLHRRPSKHAQGSTDGSSHAGSVPDDAGARDEHVELRDSSLPAGAGTTAAAPAMQTASGAPRSLPRGTPGPLEHIAPPPTLALPMLASFDDVLASHSSALAAAVPLAPALEEKAPAAFAVKQLPQLSEKSPPQPGAAPLASAPRPQHMLGLPPAAAGGVSLRPQANGELSLTRSRAPASEAGVRGAACRIRLCVCISHCPPGARAGR